ncbi:ThiF family adenylyltransferase [Lentzea sp. JNUCC 0626]|uniref:ThiF family adenylyltransferase n=1 Tax=Lentzea sp. JNUCC 0626 TaxID=3367513 RepID=UPI00374A55A8
MIISALPELAETCDVTSWRPELLDAAQLPDLFANCQVTAVHDRIDDQLEELISAREPGRVRTPGEWAAAKAEVLGGRQQVDYGTWAFYPWIGRLVHVLPRDEFRFVRTDRNRNKITREEQTAMLGKRVAVVGLSVGNSAALTAAMEGVGGAFRLADFDRLGLSNLNRLRTGVHDLGVEKTVLCARQLFELDPYLDVEIWRAGLTGENLDGFLDGADLVVEECDTAWVKIAIREQARHRGIPVLMDTNDRGLLDVERFDLEPDRPLLHGRIGDVTANEVAGLDRAEMVALMVQMVDGTRISPALTQAMTEIGRTLSSWPQLASGTMLGGALVTDAARRVLLGKPLPSGRYYVDLETIVGGAT